MLMKQRMKRRICIILIAIGVILLLCVFPEKIRASNDFESVDLYYYAFKENGEVYFDAESFCFYGSFTEEQKAFIIFENLLNHTVKGKISFVPEGTKLLDLKISGDILVLNVSEEFRQYGGTAYENALLKQLALNAMNFKGVKRLTLMIDGNYELLPEGKFIYESQIGEILNAD